MTKMPRTTCEFCRRTVAALPHGVAQWRASRHDAPDVPRESTGALVSCIGSLRPVEPAALDLQLPLPGQEQQAAGTTLF
ncbi:hypothetical protein [Kitasatospora terrestris]